METILIIGMVICLVWLALTYVGGSSEKPAAKPVEASPVGAAQIVVPSIAVKSVERPRWHKFDTLLELQEYLRASGVDEKEVQTICADIAAKLLGAK